MSAWIETLKRPLTIYIAAVALRLALILFGEYQDANFAVKYTDVDYMVYTDAARFVTLGESPFRRATYRYTPYLAWLLTPNILIHPAFGKLCFAALDLLVAILIERLLVLSMPKKNSTTVAACLIAWLFNPFVFTVSTRGNADVLIAALVLASLYCLLTRKLCWGSIWYGLAVHFKIYPIYFVLAILLYLDNTYGVDKPAAAPKPSLFTRIITLNQFINRPRVIFALVSFTTFAVLTAVAYVMYDFEFVYETYLYHLVRKDNRHNFSVYFYHLYLRFEAASAGVTSLLAFLPQVLLMIALSFRFARTDLPFCLFAQTLTFVAFNKVCTAQYFVWYLSLLPIVAPHSTMSLKRALVLFVMFFAGELHWLFWGYQLEFLGLPVFAGVWAAGLLFFAANIFALHECVRFHQLGSFAALK